MTTIRRTFREIIHYPSVVMGLVIVLALLGIAAYALITIPYQEAIRLWRGGEGIWYQNPKNAQPEWVNYFRREKLPKTLIFNSQDNPASKTVQPGTTETAVTITFTFDYAYDSFPQEMMIYFTTRFTKKQPYALVTWLAPDGQETRIGDFVLGATDTFRFSQDSRLQRRVGGVNPVQGLLALDPAADPLVPRKGTYTLKIEGVLFEADSDIDVEFILYGRVYGLAGTDHMRRDLTVALLWGTPVALAFGLLAALGTTVLTMVIAAVGAWYGKWVDEVIQRITDVNLILPLLPILIMVGTFYSHSIWVILGVTILLNIFGAGIKSYRAIFLQVRESQYIEAARSYGAGNLRVIFLYLIPRIIPTIIPQLVISIPTFVFLEASLAVLGLGDPTLPTWGKVINDAQANGALYQGMYYWVLEPSVLLMVTGLAFALLGFALDRIFNPRLRGM
jgi:peptide/nickel transport system permease protein